MNYAKRPHLHDLQAGKQPGFALVATVSMMVLLTLVCMGMLGLATVEQRSSNNSNKYNQIARANARMALMIAIGELQKASGPDQRVTATASLLDAKDPAGNPIKNGYTNPSSLALPPYKPADGRRHWVGVWDTSNYSPASPDSKSFVRWLVSGNEDNTGDDLDSMSAAGTIPGTDDVLIFESAEAAGSVKVPKVEVVGSATDVTSHYAYWVEDNGVKADLEWNDGNFSDDGREQIARLSAAPGPDHGVFGGPFESGMSYPIIDDGSNGWLVNLKKASSPADMPLVMGSATNESAWLKQHRHDIGFNSRGVLADVKKGGLRRDLSLAFEMDDDDDVSANESPSLFNQQAGEFVGNGDQYSGQYDAPGMPVRERFLYRVTQNDGSPFSSQLVRADSVVRGPNWWALRDYYNLYKRLNASGGSYSMNPRAYFPNNSAPPNSMLFGLWPDNNYRYLMQPGGGTKALFDQEVVLGTGYVFHPAKANYAPVFMGAVGLYSAKVKNDMLTLMIDPVIYLWNPYNITLNIPKYGIALDRGHGGKITFKVIKKDANGNITSEHRYGPATTQTLIERKIHGYNSAAVLTYLVSDLTMAPGEVLVLSPGAGSDVSATDLHDELTPGVNLTDSSGIEINQFPRTEYTYNQWTEKWGWEAVDWESVTIDSNDEVRCLYDVFADNNSDQLAGSAEHFWLSAFIPDDLTVSAGSLVNADTDADRVQTIGGNLARRSWAGIEEHIVPNLNSINDYPETSWPNFTGVTGGKFFFGINAFLLKPTAHSDSDGGAMPNQNAVEILSQFNPFRTGSFSESFRVCEANEIFSSISQPGSINTYVQNIGIQFPPLDTRRGYWGESYNGNGGSTALSFIDIPTSPILSLADFANANLSLRASDPYKKVGNSHASIFVPSNTLYSNPRGNFFTASDSCWLINDALFDRYYLSGISPEFNHSGVNGAYNPTGTLEETLEVFYGVTGTGYQDAEANPALEPYIPVGKTSAQIVTELTPTNGNHDGYMKIGAYSLIKGAFNVNSTSVKAWESLLRANRNLSITNSDGGTDDASGTPFPSGTTPVAAGGGAEAGWSGFSRLSDAEIEDLAQNIVNEVKARGPFMSISDFVNRQLSDNDELNAAGALQSALDGTSQGLYDLKEQAGGVQPVDPAENTYLSYVNFPGDVDLSSRLSTEGIAGDIRQADLLRALAPRLSARSDTFRIRSYGEVADNNGNILAQAFCEALVQRLPEFVDTMTDSENNEPWDEGSLNSINQIYGRRYEIRSFRWLDDSEI